MLCTTVAQALEVPLSQRHEVAPPNFAQQRVVATFRRSKSFFRLVRRKCVVGEGFLFLFLPMFSMSVPSPPPTMQPSPRSDALDQGRLFSPFPLLFCENPSLSCWVFNIILCCAAFCVLPARTLDAAAAAAGLDPNAMHPEGWSPLHAAAINKSAGICKVLLEARAKTALSNQESARGH